MLQPPQFTTLDLKRVAKCRRGSGAASFGSTYYSDGNLMENLTALLFGRGTDAALPTNVCLNIHVFLQEPVGCDNTKCPGKRLD